MYLFCNICSHRFQCQNEEECNAHDTEAFRAMDKAVDKAIKARKNDQTAKADKGKLKLSLVPRKIIRAIAWIRMYGNKKYGDPENWRQVDIERYRDAAYRHFLAYLDDPHGLDPESGLPHLWHLDCNLAFLTELEEYNVDEPGRNA